MMRSRQQQHPAPSAWRHVLRRTVPLCVALVGVATVVFAVVPPGVADAQFTRVELPSPSTTGVPSRFEELSVRILAAGMTITWQDPPSYDPHFTGSGGAMAATLSADVGRGVFADITWLRLDTLAQREQYVAELVANFGADGYIQWASDGLHVVQVYAHNYDPNTARDVLHRLQVR